LDQLFCEPILIGCNGWKPKSFKLFLIYNLTPFVMSKGQDKKKEEKKKPTKTLKEKRAEKRAKKEGK
jgi:hypothetical protein